MGVRPDKYRISSWLDTSNFNVPEIPRLYGIEARIAPRKWVRCGRDGKLLVFKTAAEAEAEKAKLEAP
jgi:hypothetical protein